MQLNRTFLINIYSKISLLKYTLVGSGFLTPYFFINWDSLHARLNSHYKAWSYKKKKHKKIKAYKKTPLYWLPSLFQILPNLPPALFVALFLWRVIDHAISDVLFVTPWYYEFTHVEPWQFSITRTLRCALCYKASVYWILTHDMDFC